MVLVFYRGGWCPICNKQLAELSIRHGDFQNTGVEIVALSNETAENGKIILKKIGPIFPLLYDVDSKVIKSYNTVVQKRDPLGWILGKKKLHTPQYF